MRYCAYFCEENVWHLCRDEGVTSGGAPVPLERRRVVFVSNASRIVPMWHQRAGRGGVVYWDYHVVLLAEDEAGWCVWDLDCDLGMPLPLSTWLAESFPGELAADAAPRFRVVDAARYLEVFSSDRSHMLDVEGRPQQTFPPWPPLRGRGDDMNLMRFVDVTRPYEGDVLTLEELSRRHRS